MRTDIFQSCGHCWVFQIYCHIECSTFRASSFWFLNGTPGIPLPPLASKTHLTLPSKMSGSRWVITPSWLSGITTNCGQFLEMGIPDHLTCLLRNLYAGQETTVRIGHGTRGWFKIGKGVCQGCILPPCLFNLYAEYIMQNARLEESQAEIKISRRNVNNLRYSENTMLMVELKRN